MIPQWVVKFYIYFFSILGILCGTLLAFRIFLCFFTLF